MTTQPSYRLETEALIEAIWGSPAPQVATPAPDQAQRVSQNAALAAAMRAYLQQYLHEAADENSRNFTIAR